ncbi:MAG: 3-isopropylmalate dehydratase small subunit [Methylacidiphilales bacterium]|nr:3-isopropylmalate dehydratase small subunit [Candidatus Methylacidiphilales bacterium]
MKAFTTFNGIVAPLMRDHIDTDAIMPKQYLKMIGKTGYGEVLFDDWRYLQAGAVGVNHQSREINPEFVLNAPQYQHAQILVCGENFGCGSSREHAVWGLVEYGIRCVIASSFAEIFFNNAIQNGLLPAILPRDVTLKIANQATMHAGYSLQIDLQQCTIVDSYGLSTNFSIHENAKNRLIKGLDDIDEILLHKEKIVAFEKQRKLEAPWLYD